MSIPFTLDIATQPTTKDIKWLSAGDWATFDDLVAGLEAGDELEQAAFTVKVDTADSDTASTSVQRIINQVESVNGLVTDATRRVLFYFQPADTEKMKTAHNYDLQIWVRRGSSVYNRTILRGRIYAREDITNTTVLIDPATTLVITNGATASGTPGDQLQLVTEIRDGSGALHPEYNPVYSTSDGAIATVDANGLVSFWTAGSVVISATLAAFGLADSIAITVAGTPSTAVEGDILTYRTSVWVPENPNTRFVKRGGDTVAGAYTWSDVATFSAVPVFSAGVPTLLPSVNTKDIGATATRWRDGWFSGAVAVATLESNVGIRSKRNGSDTALAGPYLAMENASGTRRYSWQLGDTANDWLKLFFWNGTTDTNILSINATGGISGSTASFTIGTFSGNVTVGGNAVANAKTIINGTDATGKFLEWQSAGVVKWQAHSAATTHVWTLDSASATALSITQAGAVTVPVSLTSIGNLTTNGIFVSDRSTDGKAIRVYSAGVGVGHQWDIYGSGVNLRVSDNTGGGSFNIDTAMSVTGTFTTGQTYGAVISGVYTSPLATFGANYYSTGAARLRPDGAKAGMMIEMDVTDSWQFSYITAGGVATYPFKVTTAGAVTAGAASFTTLAASGTITSTKDGLLMTRIGASTGVQYIQFLNTSGDAAFGVSGATVGGDFFSSNGLAYETGLSFKNGKQLTIGIFAGAGVAAFTSTQFVVGASTFVVTAATGAVAMTNALAINPVSAGASFVSFAVGGVIKSYVGNEPLWTGAANNLALVAVAGGGIRFFTNGSTTPGFTLASGDAITLSAQPAFVAGSKYLVIDATGNVQVSALGPAS